MKDMYQDSIVIFGEVDGVIDLCINQTKKKGTQSKYSVCLVVACKGGVYTAPLFYLL
ncbi:hypothetical protein HTVC033P_gp34 [Pelagibacter phage HTVC033P]|nr:hypothetical protein HTVC033P_gp34 [Pelagibacter phage HTVC033P]